MTYEKVKDLKSSDFKRFCGIHRPTFDQMSAILRKAEAQKSPGRPSKLSIEDQLLMSLGYWREYRTYFHIAQTWGVNESTVCRIIRKVEDELIKSGTFSLAGSKQLLKPDNTIKTLVVDVTESPIERPKKNRNDFTVEKRRNTHLNPK